MERFASQRNHAKEHIIIVEDDEDGLELLRYNFTKEGFRCP